MKKQLLFALMLLMVGIQAQSKELHESSFLRLGLGFGGQYELYEEGGDEVEFSSSSFGGMMTFKIEHGPFLQMGSTKHWMDEVRVNNTVYDSDDSASTIIIGGGFRFPLGMLDGFYIGLGYQNMKINGEDVNDLHTTGIFLEEEQKTIMEGYQSPKSD